MARGKMNEEVLALSRAAKHIEELEDPRAQARVASFLYMRFTAAGEQILTHEDRTAYNVKPDVDPRQPLLPYVAPEPLLRPATAATAGTPPASPMAPGTAHSVTSGGDGASETPVPATTRPAVASGASAEPDLRDPPTTVPVGPGWDLTGKGSENDDTPAPKGPAPRKPPETKKATANADGGWDLGDGNGEVEVKI